MLYLETLKSQQLLKDLIMMTGILSIAIQRCDFQYMDISCVVQSTSLEMEHLGVCTKLPTRTRQLLLFDILVLPQLIVCV